jgi:hypothetical protein
MAFEGDISFATKTNMSDDGGGDMIGQIPYCSNHLDLLNCPH